jgi:hypothetical protein
LYFLIVIVIHDAAAYRERRGSGLRDIIKRKDKVFSILIVVRKQEGLLLLFMLVLPVMAEREQPARLYRLGEEEVRRAPLYCGRYPLWAAGYRYCCSPRSFLRYHIL